MPDFRITIDVKDVAGGDIDFLAEQIRNEHGDNFDADNGDFIIRVSQKQGENYFERDPGDDVLT